MSRRNSGGKNQLNVCLKRRVWSLFLKSLKLSFSVRHKPAASMVKSTLSTQYKGVFWEYAHYAVFMITILDMKTNRIFMPCSYKGNLDTVHKHYQWKTRCTSKQQRLLNHFFYPKLSLCIKKYIITLENIPSFKKNSHLHTRALADNFHQHWMWMCACVRLCVCVFCISVLHSHTHREKSKRQLGSFTWCRDGQRFRS